jgi:hypothetical protein
MVKRCPHGKRIKTFASCGVCDAEINAIAIARLASRHARILSRSVTIEFIDHDSCEWIETPTYCPE